MQLLPPYFKRSQSPCKALSFACAVLYRILVIRCPSSTKMSARVALFFTHVTFMSQTPFKLSSKCNMNVTQCNISFFILSLPNFRLTLYISTIIVIFGCSPVCYISFYAPYKGKEA